MMAVKVALEMKLDDAFKSGFSPSSFRVKQYIQHASVLLREAHTGRKLTEEQ